MSEEIKPVQEQPIPEPMKEKKTRKKNFRFELPSTVERQAPEKTAVGKLAGKKLRTTKDREVLQHVSNAMVEEACKKYNTSPGFVTAVIDAVFQGKNTIDAFISVADENGLTGNAEDEVAMRQGARAVFTAFGIYIPKYLPVDMKIHDPKPKA